MRAESRQKRRAVLPGSWHRRKGTHNIFEGRQAVAAARKHRRIVQHGTQCRSSPLIREGIELLHKGVIGRVYHWNVCDYSITARSGTAFFAMPDVGGDAYSYQRTVRSGE